jgi:PleD family two-component response regulator
VSVTISVGGAWQTAEEADAQSLLGNADAALYEAKHLGRNRYHVWP